MKKLIWPSILLMLILASCAGRGPTISEISPRIGNMGEVLTIKGSGFGSERGENRISISDIYPTASSYIAWSDDTISVRIPEFGESGLVYVIVNNHKSNPALFSNRASLPRPLAAGESSEGPKVTALDPAAGSVGSLVTITGKNFGSSRDTGTVMFTWLSENSASAPATMRQPMTIDASELEFAYELWSDTEIRVRVPDGAASGNIIVKTDKGTSDPVYFDASGRPGTKTFRDKRSYAITYSVNVQAKKAKSPNSLYLWIPQPAPCASQRSIQLLSRSAEPFLDSHKGPALYQLKDLSSSSSTTVSLSWLVDVYAIETHVKPESIPEGAASPIRAAYTLASPLVPSDRDEIRALANEICGDQKNPYYEAKAIYEWMSKGITWSTGNAGGGAMEALMGKQADAYSGTLLFTALTRARGIPTIPFAGFLIDRNRSSVKHWWLSFWIDGFGWVPVDPALGSGMGVPGFTPRDGAHEYYFGNLDNQRLALSQGLSQLAQIDPRGRITSRDRSYSFQTIWEEATGGLESWSTLWSDLSVSGVY